MKIIFVHHAMRDRKHPRGPESDITRLGIKDAKIVARLLENSQKRGDNLKAIYTSPFKRCVKTANIINSKVKLPIFTDERLNECGSVQGESWVEFQLRVRAALKDVVQKYGEDETVICVTSGVNIVVFMQLAFGLPASENAPTIGVPSCSPMMFEITKQSFVELAPKSRKKEK